MFCEPNYYLPVKLEELFPKKTTSTETEEDNEPTEYQVEYDAGYYNVLPLLSYNNKHLNDVLSLERNEFLNLRWEKFVTRIPENYVKISLYTDFVKKKEPVRRMTLNGQFYGSDNKLSPVPYFPDPREYDKLPKASATLK